MAWYLVIAAAWLLFLLAAAWPKLVECGSRERVLAAAVGSALAALWPILLPIVAGVAFRSLCLE